MSFSTSIAVRFLKSRRSRFVSLITVVAILGITLGVMALDVTLAVLNGFRDQIQKAFVDNMPMVTVLTHDPRGFSDIPALVEQIESSEGVVAASPFLRSEGVLTQHRGRQRNKAVVVWGIDAEQQDRVTPLVQNIAPDFTGFDASPLTGPTEHPGIVLGSELAASLYAGLGDELTLTVPTNTAGSLDEIGRESAAFVVVGVLSSGMYDFDQSFAYIDLEAARALFAAPGAADGIGVRITNMMEATAVADRLETELGSPPYWSNDWIRLNSQLFEYIAMEKKLMFLLLSLITLVASFGVVAILTMTVRDRQRDIGVLLSLGVSKRSLVAIFVSLGVMLGAIGTALGTGLGAAVCLYLDTIGYRLPGDVYFIETLPVHTKASDMLMVAGFAMAMSFLATLLPSWMATRFTPVEVLRYE